MLTFSIITPTLNADRFLTEAIQSIASQQVVDVEHWVIDGGSTDETPLIAQQNAKYVHWVSQKGMGQSAAINYGWSQTRGEILSWLNADDLLMPGALQQVSAYFEAHPETDILYGDCDYINASGDFLWHYPTQTFSYPHLVENAFNYIPQPATFIRRCLLEKVGWLNEDFHYVMDFDYWLRAGLQCKIDHLPHKLSAMRLHSDAKSIANLAAFAPELVAMYQSLFASPDMPANIRQQEIKAMSTVLYRASNCAYWGREMKQARQYAFEAWRLRPWFPRRQLWLALLGNPVQSLLRKVRKDPHNHWNHAHG